MPDRNTEYLLYQTLVGAWPISAERLLAYQPPAFTTTPPDQKAVEDGPRALGTFAGARSGLLGKEDGLEAANALDPGTTGVVLVYENAWAGPFVAAARAAGGELVASSRLTADEVIDALDALDSLDASEPAR